MDYEKLSYEDIHKLILDDEEKYNEIPIEILRKKLYEHQIYVWYTSGAFIGYDISNYTISSEKLSLRKKIINYYVVNQIYLQSSKNCLKLVV